MGVAKHHSKTAKKGHWAERTRWPMTPKEKIASDSQNLFSPLAAVLESLPAWLRMLARINSDGEQKSR